MSVTVAAANIKKVQIKMYSVFIYGSVTQPFDNKAIILQVFNQCFVPLFMPGITFIKCHPNAAIL